VLTTSLFTRRILDEAEGLQVITMNINRLITVTIAILLIAGSAKPVAGPAPNLDTLTAQSRLIVMGQITSVKEEGKTSVQMNDHVVAARAMSAELRVDQVLKGNSETGYSTLQFQFVLPDEFVGWRSISPSYRIFFLAGSPGELKLADAYYPSAVATPGTTAQGTTPIERVIDELRQVLESTKSSSEEKREAIFALGTTASPAAIFALARVGEIKDVTIRLSIAAALLARNDLSTLEFAVDALLKPDPALSPDVLHNLSYAISEGVKDKNAVSSLARLLHASDTEARRAAASALMHVSSSTCIDPLLFALDDPDLEVRYYSVVGLAEITGQTEEWRPNMDDFKSAQEKYIRHWREWSKSR
jgi:PBS lyase HEAT-like repeat